MYCIGSTVSVLFDGGVRYTAEVIELCCGNQLRLRYHADGDIEVVGADEVLPCTRADSPGAVGKRLLKVKANALKRMGVQLERAKAKSAKAGKMDVDYGTAEGSSTRARRRQRKKAKEQQEQGSASLPASVTAEPENFVEARIAALQLGAAVGLRAALTGTAPLAPDVCLLLGLMVLWASVKSPAVLQAGVGGRPGRVELAELAKEDNRRYAQYRHVNLYGKTDAATRLESARAAASAAGDGGLEAAGRLVGAAVRLQCGAALLAAPPGRDFMDAVVGAVRSSGLIFGMHAGASASTDAYYWGHAIRMVLFVLAEICGVAAEAIVEADDDLSTLPFQGTLKQNYAEVDTDLRRAGTSLMQLGNERSMGVMAVSCLTCRLLGTARDAPTGPRHQYGSVHAWLDARYPALVHARSDAHGGEIGGCEATRALLLRVCHFERSAAWFPPRQHRTPLKKHGDAYPLPH
jgi:hypothetical protein